MSEIYHQTSSKVFVALKIILHRWWHSTVDQMMMMIMAVLLGECLPCATANDCVHFWSIVKKKSYLLSFHYSFLLQIFFSFFAFLLLFLCTKKIRNSKISLEIGFGGCVCLCREVSLSIWPIQLCSTVSFDKRLCMHIHCRNILGKDMFYDTTKIRKMVFHFY